MSKEMSSLEMPKPMLDYVTSEMMPEIKDWKVGDKYVLKVEVEMKSIRKPEQKKELYADFIVNKITPIGTQSQMERLKKKYA